LRTTSRIIRTAACVALLALSASVVFAQGRTTSPTFTVDVIATTPLPDVGLTLDQIPAPVQTLTTKDLDESGALNIADFLNRRLNAVHVNDMQGNPFQSDLNYRGYTASPLLGTPQGVSVYMDGVRLNQPFGDVVSWDLIPRIAIASGTLMPGSNPLFGLNTLGGALSLQTKDGLADTGTRIQAFYGSHIRRAVEFEHGGASRRGLHWYVAGNLFGEDGWRDDSLSDVRQLFGKLGWQRPRTAISLTVAHADNALTGNGLQEQQLLARDFDSVYTKPDTTDNRSTLLNLNVRRRANERLTLSGNLYYRHISTRTLNGDINEDALDQSLYQPGAAEIAALAAHGYTDVPSSGLNASNTPFPFLRCLGNVFLQDEPGEKCNGLINRTRTTQHNAGLSGQATWQLHRGTRTNQLTAGGAYDASAVAFVQSTELGYLNPDRSVTGTGAFGDGVSGGNVDGEPFDARVDLDGRLHTSSVFATDTLSLNDTWHLTASGRVNQTVVRNRDGITPGDDPASLDGHHTFSRFNPAAGVTYSPRSTLNLYAGYSEGSRAATSIELGCANPEQPCKLPNAMAGDPPLQQVVTRTLESGIRGGHVDRASWSAAIFRAENRDDILFVASSQTGFGYFKNFGRTRRQGLELAFDDHLGRVNVGAGYTWLDATFQSAETMDGTGNSANDDAREGARGLEGTIEIVPGDHLPLIPRHMVKLYAEVQATTALSLDVNLLGISSSFARGNENNIHAADGMYYLGPGEAPGYAVVNVGARYRLPRGLQLLLRIDNLFDRRYDTAAQLGPNGFASNGAFTARPFPAVNGEFPVQQSTFFAPGAPRLWSAGLEVRF
jgi:outer membrane receptor protein involved in Fe transport